VEVCIVASYGGHLELLRAVEGAYRDRSRLFVLPASRQAEELRAAGERVEEIINPRRNPALLARGIARAVAIVRRERPRVVLSSGAGLAAPVCIAAKLTGSSLIFVETMARVHRGSATGRLLYRLADRFLVQWPELRRVYPRAEVCRPALLERIGAEHVPPGEGTFVATGHHLQQFDRLLRLADDGVAAGTLPLPALAQVGPSGYRPRNLEAVETLPPADMPGAIRSSRVVLCHGGAGLISVALRNGRVPLVLSRRRRYREHIDDHQVAMTAKLASIGLAVSLDDQPLESAVALSDRPVAAPRAGIEGPPLTERLRELIDRMISQR
jgi:UDP-N-acetylglucosamine transferase subunit ALG13